MKLTKNFIISTALVLQTAQLSAEYRIALIKNYTGENITLRCGTYTLTIAAGKSGKPFRLAVPSACNCAASIGTETQRIIFWRQGAHLVQENGDICTVALKNIDFRHTAGLLIEVMPDGVHFRPLADFEVSPTGTVYA